MCSASIFRWGVMAPGRIARRFGEALPVIPGARLAAVASRDAGRGQHYAKTYSDPDTPARVFTDYQAMVEDPNVDAVYIASPHRFHYDSIRQCLEAGKPVLCEKPLTVSAAQAEDLFSLAEERGVFLMEALWSRFTPSWQQARGWLDEGVIGEIHSLQASFSIRIQQGPEDRLLNPALAGGTTLDMGVYPVNLSQFVLGEDPQQVQTLARLGRTGVDVMASTQLRYESAIAQFTTGFLTKRYNVMRIDGTLGSIEFPDRFWDAREVTLSLQDGRVHHLTCPYRSNGFEYQIEEVMRCVRAGKLQSDIMPWADTLGVARVLDEMLAQAGVRYDFL